MERKTKRTKGCLIVLALPILVFVALGAYFAWTETNARVAARSFCQSVEIGSSVEDAVERARNLGAYSHKTNEEVTIEFMGSVWVSKHICAIKVSGSRINSAEYFHID